MSEVTFTFLLQAYWLLVLWDNLPEIYVPTAGILANHVPELARGILGTS